MWLLTYGHRGSDLKVNRFEFCFDFSTFVLSSESGTPVLEHGFTLAAYWVLLVLRLRTCDL